MPGDEVLRAGALAVAIGALTVEGLLLYIRPEQSEREDDGCGGRFRSKATGQDWVSLVGRWWPWRL